jgi:hypothetical protein
MRSGRLALLALLVAGALAGSLGCAAGGGRGLFREYEYEEEIYLDLDGSATVMVNASIPALVALHGLELDPRPRARLDRRKLRALYESPVTEVTRVSNPWRRHGRRFVQIRIAVEDIRELGKAMPFAWSAYQLQREPDAYLYRQTIAASAGRDIGDVGWTGSELVAFRLHLPSRIQYHNAKDISRPGPDNGRDVERGNIVSWEQSLTDRLRGEPVVIEARMDTQSILYSTLWLFAMAFGAAMSVLAAIVWWVMRRRDEASQEA